MTVTVRLTAATEPLFTAAAALFDEYRQHYGANPAPEAVAAWMLEQILSTRARIYVACSEAPDSGPPSAGTTQPAIAPGPELADQSSNAGGRGATPAARVARDRRPGSNLDARAGRRDADPVASGAHNLGSGTNLDTGAAGRDAESRAHDLGSGSNLGGTAGSPSTAPAGVGLGTTLDGGSVGGGGAGSGAVRGAPLGPLLGPVAYGICSVAVVPAALTLRTVWVIRDLFVVRNARGRGHARALLTHVAREARAAGAHRLSLQTETANVRAIELYAKNGFDVLTDVAVMDRLL